MSFSCSPTSNPPDTAVSHHNPYNSITYSSLNQNQMYHTDSNVIPNLYSHIDPSTTSNFQEHTLVRPPTPHDVVFSPNEPIPSPSALLQQLVDPIYDLDTIISQLLPTTPHNNINENCLDDIIPLFQSRMVSKLLPQLLHTLTQPHCSTHTPSLSTDPHVPHPPPLAHCDGPNISLDSPHNTRLPMYNHIFGMMHAQGALSTTTTTGNCLLTALLLSPQFYLPLSTRHSNTLTLPHLHDFTAPGDYDDMRAVLTYLLKTPHVNKLMIPFCQDFPPLEAPSPNEVFLYEYTSYIEHYSPFFNDSDLSVTFNVKLYYILLLLIHIYHVNPSIGEAFEYLPLTLMFAYPHLLPYIPLFVFHNKFYSNAHGIGVEFDQLQVQHENHVEPDHTTCHISPHNSSTTPIPKSSTSLMDLINPCGYTVTQLALFMPQQPYQPYVECYHQYYADLTCGFSEIRLAHEAGLLDPPADVLTNEHKDEKSPKNDDIHLSRPLYIEINLYHCLQYRPNLAIPSYNNETALELAISRAQPLSIIFLLLQSGADLNYIPPTRAAQAKFTPLLFRLFIANSYSPIELLMFFLIIKRELDIKVNFKITTPAVGNMNIVQFLLTLPRFKNNLYIIRIFFEYYDELLQISAQCTAQSQPIPEWVESTLRCYAIDVYHVDTHHKSLLAYCFFNNIQNFDIITYISHKNGIFAFDNPNNTQAIYNSIYIQREPTPQPSPQNQSQNQSQSLTNSHTTQDYDEDNNDSESDYYEGSLLQSSDITTTLSNGRSLDSEDTVQLPDAPIVPQFLQSTNFTLCEPVFHPNLPQTPPLVEGNPTNIEHFSKIFSKPQISTEDHLTIKPLLKTSSSHHTTTDQPELTKQKSLRTSHQTSPIPPTTTTPLTASSPSFTRTLSHSGALYNPQNGVESPPMFPTTHSKFPQHALPDHISSDNSSPVLIDPAVVTKSPELSRNTLNRGAFLTQSSHVCTTLPTSTHSPTSINHNTSRGTSTSPQSIDIQDSPSNGNIVSKAIINRVVKMQKRADIVANSVSYNTIDSKLVSDITTNNDNTSNNQLNLNTEKNQNNELSHTIAHIPQKIPTKPHYMSYKAIKSLEIELLLSRTINLLHLYISICYQYNISFSITPDQQYVPIAFSPPAIDIIYHILKQNMILLQRHSKTPSPRGRFHNNRSNIISKIINLPLPYPNLIAHYNSITLKQPASPVPTQHDLILHIPSHSTSPSTRSPHEYPQFYHVDSIHSPDLAHALKTLNPIIAIPTPIANNHTSIESSPYGNNSANVMGSLSLHPPGSKSLSLIPQSASYEPKSPLLIPPHYSPDSSGDAVAGDSVQDETNHNSQNVIQTRAIAMNITSSCGNHPNNTAPVTPLDGNSDCTPHGSEMDVSYRNTNNISDLSDSDENDEDDDNHHLVDLQMGHIVNLQSMMGKIATNFNTSTNISYFVATNGGNFSQNVHTPPQLAQFYTIAPTYIRALSSPTGVSQDTIKSRSAITTTSATTTSHCNSSSGTHMSRSNSKTPHISLSSQDTGIENFSIPRSTPHITPQRPTLSLSPSLVESPLHSPCHFSHRTPSRQSILLSHETRIDMMKFSFNTINSLNNAQNNTSNPDFMLNIVVNKGNSENYQQFTTGKCENTHISFFTESNVSPCSHPKCDHITADTQPSDLSHLFPLLNSPANNSPSTTNNNFLSNTSSKPHAVKPPTTPHSIPQQHQHSFTPKYSPATPLAAPNLFPIQSPPLPPSMPVIKQSNIYTFDRGSPAHTPPIPQQQHYSRPYTLSSSNNASSTPTSSFIASLPCNSSSNDEHYPNFSTFVTNYGEIDKKCQKIPQNNLVGDNDPYCPPNHKSPLNIDFQYPPDNETLPQITTSQSYLNTETTNFSPGGVHISFNISNSFDPHPTTNLPLLTFANTPSHNNINTHLPFITTCPPSHRTNNAKSQTPQHHPTSQLQDSALLFASSTQHSQTSTIVLTRRIAPSHSQQRREQLLTQSHWDSHPLSGSTVITASAESQPHSPEHNNTPCQHNADENDDIRQNIPSRTFHRPNETSNTASPQNTPNNASFTHITNNNNNISMPNNFSMGAFAMGSSGSAAETVVHPQNHIIASKPRHHPPLTPQANILPRHVLLHQPATALQKQQFNDTGSHVSTPTVIFDHPTHNLRSFHLEHNYSRKSIVFPRNSLSNHTSNGDQRYIIEDSFSSFSPSNSGVWRGDFIQTNNILDPSTHSRANIPALSIKPRGYTTSSRATPSHPQTPVETLISDNRKSKSNAQTSHHPSPTEIIESIRAQFAIPSNSPWASDITCLMSLLCQYNALQQYFRQNPHRAAILERPNDVMKRHRKEQREREKADRDAHNHITLDFTPKHFVQTQTPHSHVEWTSVLSSVAAQPQNNQTELAPSSSESCKDHIVPYDITPMGSEAGDAYQEHMNNVPPGRYPDFDTYAVENNPYKPAGLTLRHSMNTIGATNKIHTIFFTDEGKDSKSLGLNDTHQYRHDAVTHNTSPQDQPHHKNGVNSQKNQFMGNPFDRQSHKRNSSQHITTLPPIQPQRCFSTRPQPSPPLDFNHFSPPQNPSASFKSNDETPHDLVDTNNTIIHEDTTASVTTIETTGLFSCGASSASNKRPIVTNTQYPCCTALLAFQDDLLQFIYLFISASPLLLRLFSFIPPHALPSTPTLPTAASHIPPHHEMAIFNALFSTNVPLYFQLVEFTTSFPLSYHNLHLAIPHILFHQTTRPLVHPQHSHYDALHTQLSHHLKHLMNFFPIHHELYSYSGTPIDAISSQHRSQVMLQRGDDLGSNHNNTEIDI